MSVQLRVFTLVLIIIWYTVRFQECKGCVRLVELAVREFPSAGEDSKTGSCTVIVPSNYLSEY